MIVEEPSAQIMEIGASIRTIENLRQQKLAREFARASLGDHEHRNADLLRGP
jgi:hypothetical protein